MKVKKGVIVLVLISVLVIGSFTTAFASNFEGKNPTTQENINIMCAYALHDIGLFQGTNEGFELNTKATRLQGIVMFIRILGQENAAVSGGSDTTFSDVPTWGKAYTAYAEKQELTNGLGNGLFGSNNLMSARDYATFLLRGLGYSDSNGDFTYTDSLDYMAKIGAISKEECDYLKNNDFKRGEMALLSYRTLCTESKGTNVPLIEKLGLGTVLEADYTGIKGDDGGCAFQIQFKDLSAYKSVSKYYCSPLGYDFPLDNCYTYRQLSKDFGTKAYNPISSLEYMTIGASSDNGTEGQFTHGFVLCDNSGKELALIRLYSSQENQPKHQEKFIAVAFPQSYAAPKAITEGINYDKTTGSVTLDKQAISGQIGDYTKIYSTWIKWDLDGANGFTPDTAMNAMNGRNGIKTYDGNTTSISVDPSKYYQVLLFMDAEGNPLGYTTLEK